MAIRLDVTGTAPLSLSVGRFHLKLYAGFILNIPIMGHPSHFVPCCHWCLSTDVVLVTPEMAQLTVWNTEKKKKASTQWCGSDLISGKSAVMSTRNVQVWQNLRSCRCQRDGHLHSSTNGDLFDTVIGLKKKVPFNTERVCLNKVQMCAEWCEIRWKFRNRWCWNFSVLYKE